MRSRQIAARAGPTCAQPAVTLMYRARMLNRPELVYNRLQPNVTANKNVFAPQHS